MFPAIEQIDYLIQNWIGLSSFSASGDSGNPTTAMGTALNTAGKGGTVLPNQAGGNSAMGWVNAGNNTVMIFNSTTKETIKDVESNVVYGRLTGSSPYTVLFFSMVGAVETAYSFASATNVDLFLPYVYQAGRMPIDLGVRLAQYAGGDLPVAGQVQPQYFTEALTIATDNTIPVLTKSPSSTAGIFLKIRGIDYDSTGINPPFTAGGTGNKTLTFSATNAKHDLKAGWKVTAFYPTLE